MSFEKSTNPTIVQKKNEIMRFLREEIKVSSVRDIARRAGVNNVTLHKLINDPGRMPSIETLEKIENLIPNKGKGCQYCLDMEELKGAFSIWINDTRREMTVDLEFGPCHDYPINYCFNCGRRLGGK